MNKSSIDLSKIDTVILAGGLGTRLRTVFKDKPKCLVPINGKPFIDILLDDCIAQGLRRFILCVGYLKEQIIDHFKDRHDCKIIFSIEKEPLGTGGALGNAIPLMRSKHILVMNGDSYINTDIAKYINWFDKNQYSASILLTRVSNPTRYGCVVLREDGRIVQFNEKGKNANSGWINAGVYLYKRVVLETLPGNSVFSLERDFLPNLIEKGVFGYQTSGRFIDIGIPESYRKATYFFNDLGEKSSSAYADDLLQESNNHFFND